MLKKILHNRFVYVIIGLLISMVISHTDYFSNMFMFRAINHSFLSFLSPLSVAFIILALDFILFNFLDKKKDSKESKLFGSIKLYVLFQYFLILGSGLLTLFVIRYLFLFIGLDYRVEALFEIGYKDIFWFLIFINIFISYFLFSILVYKRIAILGLALKDRLVLVAVILFPVAIIFAVFKLFLFIFPLILSFLIYIFVLDIYMDKKSMNSTWIFTFMIVVAGFTALILFSGYSETSKLSRAEELKKSLFSPSKRMEALLDRQKIGTFEDDKVFIEQDTISSVFFLKKINNGFYNISNTLYFNPRSGDYIKLLEKYKVDDKYIIKHLYNRIPVEEVGSIIFYGDRILSNNTVYKTIPIPETFMQDTSILNEYLFDGFSYLKYRFGNKLSVIQIEKVPSILIPFSLFSMLFVLTGIFIFLISMVNSRFTFLPEIVKVSFKGIITLRDKIQFSIIGLVIVSFFILGLITFYYIMNFSKKNQKKAAIELTNNYFGKGKLDNMSATDISAKLLELNGESKAKFYLYDNTGKLVEDKRNRNNINSSIPFQNINEYISDVSKSGSHISKKDRVLLSVSPISDDKLGYVVGYFVDSNSVTEASEILSNFLNVYVLLFLIAGAIAIALANSISRPIDILGEKLEILDLSENNELLNWESQDEIGKLISIYNRTVKKLEESAKIITKIERDSAWREMAKQVAHEIKNPLTPLKLNIQYLQGIVSGSPERAADMVKQLAPGLIEQINNLDNIASEFADFAKMPSASNEKVKLNEIVKAVHDFFRKREDLDIQLYIPINDLVVFADKNHLVSILNNILKNAIQAIPTDKEGKIVIELYKKNNDAIIKIKDNGIGIEDEMISKVFSPNFTTKNSGTGLGLAISTNMVQAFNGKIYFETEVGKGTSFFVEIPLMRIQDNFPEQKRVFLD